MNLLSCFSTNVPLSVTYWIKNGFSKNRSLLFISAAGRLKAITEMRKSYSILKNSTAKHLTAYAKNFLHPWSWPWLPELLWWYLHKHFPQELKNSSSKMPSWIWHRKRLCSFLMILKKPSRFSMSYSVKSHESNTTGLNQPDQHNLGSPKDRQINGATAGGKNLIRLKSTALPDLGTPLYGLLMKKLYKNNTEVIEANSGVFPSGISRSGPPGKKLYANCS